MLTAAGLIASASGCGSAALPRAAGSPASSQSPASPPAPASASARRTMPARAHRPPGHSARQAGSLRVLTEPEAGIGPIYRLIAHARSSIELSMYELADPVAEADLAAAAARGVRVRVILDQYLEKARNAAAYAYLSAHGVHVRWGPASTIYHQKTLTADDATSVIMTGNLDAEDYPDTRDFAVVDTRRADVAAIVATFDADFSGRAIDPPDGTDLVWSPTNSEASMLLVINGAVHTLAVENEEMNDSAVTAALEAAAKHGVDVTVVMTADSSWNSAFAALRRAGVHVHTFPDSSSALYIHAKAVVADAGRSGQQVYVGSENFSVASLDENRELGIRTANAAVISAISATIASDYAHA